MKSAVILCSVCKDVVAYCAESVSKTRFSLYCSNECLKHAKHYLKLNSNKQFSNLVDTSTAALKNLLNVNVKEIPAEFRLAMFHVFKMRRIIRDEARN